jgi:hypothetical protein
VLKPFFEKFEISANSETLWTTVLEKLIISLKFSLKILRKLIKYTDVLQIKSKPHLRCFQKGDSGVVGSRLLFFQNKKLFFLLN